MSKLAKIYNAKEMLEVLKKPWLNTQDLKILSGTSIDKARELKKQIAKRLIEEEKCLLPSGLVPTDKVIEYLHINIEYLKTMAELD